MPTHDPITRRFVTLDGQRVSCLWRDGGHEGATLVFIHGSGMSARYWSDQTRALADTARVLAVDLPGRDRAGHAGAAGVPGTHARGRCRDRSVNGRHRARGWAARAGADPLRQPRSRHAARALTSPECNDRGLAAQPRRRRRPHAPDRGTRRREPRDLGLRRVDRAAVSPAAHRRRATALALEPDAPTCADVRARYTSDCPSGGHAAMRSPAGYAATLGATGV